MNEVGASSRRSLVFVLVALLALTALSWGLAQVPLGRLEDVVAMAIAAGKASLVACYFMELRFASTAARVVAGTTLAFIIILCLGVAADMALR